MYEILNLKKKDSNGAECVLGILLLCATFWVISSVDFLREVILQSRFFIFLMGFLLIICFLGYRKWEKKLTEAEVVVGIFLAAFLIRGMLVLIVPYNQAQHDTHFFGEWNGDAIGSGHFGYIQYLMKFKKLPDFDPRQVWSFYNPPLHHILCAVWMKFNAMFGMGYDACAENLQLLNLFYSSMTSYTGYRILKEFSLKGSALFLTFGLLAFHPIFAVLNLSLNNDALAVLFSAIAILYTVRWHKEQKMRYILCIALSIGLGMMTKLSVGLLSPAIGFVFLMVTIRKRDNLKNLIGQFVGFGILCFPLGLFWPVRCKVLFDIPFNYVQPLGEGDMWQYIGNYNLWQRLGIPSLAPILKNPWYIGDPAEQHNTWLEMFRTSILDEWTFQLPLKPYMIVATVLVLFSIFLGIGICVLFIWTLIHKGTMDKAMKGFCGIGYWGLVGFFVKFTFDYPFICSMNFRYIVPTFLFSVLGLGIWLQDEHTSKTGRGVAMAANMTFLALSVVLLVAYCLLFRQSDVQNL